MIHENMRELYRAIIHVADARAEYATCDEDNRYARDQTFSEVIVAEERLENALNHLEARINGSNT